MAYKYTIFIYYMLVFMQMQTTWLGESNVSVHSVSREQIIIGGGLLWSLFITVGRESVSDRECYAFFINTIPPCLSEVS